MADQYLKDYSGLAAAGGAFKGFAEAYNAGQDRNMKVQEFQAKMDAQKAQMEREAQNQALAQRKEGVKYNPTTQGFDDVAPTEHQQDAQTLSGMEKGIGTTWDPETKRPTYSYDPNSPQSIGAAAKATSADSAYTKALAADYTAKHKGEPGNKDWSKLADALDPNKARGGNLAATQKLINSADRIHAIFDQFPDGNIPKAQSTELGTAVAAMISGGSPQSQQQIHDIVPSSAAGSAEDTISWFTGNPTGRQQQEFMKVLRESSEREKNVALKQKMDAQRARLPQFSYLKAHNPDQYNQILKGYGVTEQDEAQPVSMAKGQAVAPPPQAQGLVQPRSPGLLGRLGGMLGLTAGAQPAPQKPKTIMQNGHTYTLNPATGEYE